MDWLILPHSERSAGGLVKGVGSSRPKVNCISRLSGFVKIKLVTPGEEKTQLPWQNSTELPAILFANVVEGSPGKLLVTPKFQLINAYVAFGAKPRTLVAKGASALSYVNDPETIPT